MPFPAVISSKLPVFQSLSLPSKTKLKVSNPACGCAPPTGSPPGRFRLSSINKIKGRCLCKVHRPIPPLHDVLFPKNHYANGFGLFLKYFCVSSLLCFISLKNPLLQFGETNKRRNPKQRLKNNRHCYRLLMLQMCGDSTAQISY